MKTASKESRNRGTWPKFRGRLEGKVGRSRSAAVLEKVEDTAIYRQEHARTKEYHQTTNSKQIPLWEHFASSIVRTSNCSGFNRITEIDLAESIKRSV